MRHMCRLIASTLLAIVQLSDVRARNAYDPEARLVEMKLKLPEPDAPIANYVRAVQGWMRTVHGVCTGCSFL